MSFRALPLLVLCAGYLPAAILFSTVDPLSGTEGFSLSGPLASFTDSTSPALAQLTATINWGDSFSSAGTIVGSAGNYVLSDSHTYAEGGIYGVFITINDTGDGSSAYTISPANIADAPLLAGSPVAGSGVAGVQLDGLVGTFTDENPEGQLSDFIATISWGDGSPTIAATITQPAGVGTPFDISGSHTYAVSGSYFPSLVITDLGGSTIAETASENISSAPEAGTFLLSAAGLLFAFASLRFRGPSRLAPARGGDE